MTTDFFVLCAATVPETYFWDLGVPLETEPTTKALTSTPLTEYISGYAPAVDVIFVNGSFSDPSFEFIDYSWNFGDYYHDDNNFVSLSCTAPIKHTFIMPGVYTVTLTHTQSKSREIVSFDSTENPEYCRGKYNIRWFWDELTCLTPLNSPNEFAITWNELECGARYEKWWDFEEKCFQKYCKTWSWRDLSTNNDNPEINPVKWSDTISDSEFEKKWMFEANDTICVYRDDFEYLNTVTTEEQIVSKAIIEVKEIMPVANMLSVSATTGTSPFTVQLSPRNCKTGSFPIDRIDWDFGDGTPIKTITRYAPPLETDSVINTGYFISDLEDVRNFNVVHTYTRNKDAYPVFYPSLTCYSASTNSYDSCSITIGPISFEPSITDIHLLKTRNTLKGNIYTFDINRNISLMTSNSFIDTLIPSTTTPFNKIRDSRFLFQSYYGYDGNSFPQPYTPDCNLQFTVIPRDFISTEDSTPDIITDNLQDDGVPITSEKDVVLVT
jgi:hypothetical protein